MIELGDVLEVAASVTAYDQVGVPVSLFRGQRLKVVDAGKNFLQARVLNHGMFTGPGEILGLSRNDATPLYLIHSDGL